MLRGRVRRSVALGSAALAIVVPATSGAAVEERAKIGLPERGQLAIAMSAWTPPKVQGADPDDTGVRQRETTH